jgi:hypothetical protein
LQAYPEKSRPIDARTAGNFLRKDFLLCHFLSISTPLADGTSAIGKQKSLLSQSHNRRDKNSSTDFPHALQFFAMCAVTGRQFRLPVEIFIDGSVHTD